MFATHNEAGYRDPRRSRILVIVATVVCLVAGIAVLSFLSRQASTVQHRTSTAKPAPADKGDGAVAKLPINPIDHEVNGAKPASIQSSLINAIVGFETAYFSARFDDHPSDHRARISPFVSRSFVDQADGYGNALGPSVAQIAFTREKTVIVAKVLRKADIFTGSSQQGLVISTAKVTLHTATLTGKPKVTSISDTTTWRQDDGRWTVVARGASLAGDSS